VDQPVIGAAEALDAVRRRGVRRLFLSNNSSRTPEQVAATLTEMGVEADAEEVLTSALATASFLEREGASGGRAFVIGAPGVTEALAAVGIQLLKDHPQTADLVVIGLDRTLDYEKLRTASLLVERGA